MTVAIFSVSPGGQTNWSDFEKDIKLRFRDDSFPQGCLSCPPRNPCSLLREMELGILCGFKKKNPAHRVGNKSNFQYFFNSLYNFIFFYLSSLSPTPIPAWRIHTHLAHVWFSIPVQFPHFLCNNVLCLINEGETALIDYVSDVKLSWEIFMSCKLFYAASNHASKLKSYQHGLGVDRRFNRRDGRL